MSLSFILRFGQKRVLTLLPEIRAPLSERCKNFHALCRNNEKAVALLEKVVPSLTDQARGMKTKGKLNLRCKDCYFVTRQGRRYVMCKTHGRHKQQQMVKKVENTWILTHATQHKIRPW